MTAIDSVQHIPFRASPLGIVGVISAFNFPVAVWSWNALLAAVCGDCVLWRPSSETPLTAVAVLASTGLASCATYQDELASGQLQTAEGKQQGP